MYVPSLCGDFRVKGGEFGFMGGDPCFDLLGKKVASVFILQMFLHY